MVLVESARRAYELGRLKNALRLALFVPALTALSCLSCACLARSLICGALLAVVAVGLLWRGQRMGRVVLPGVLAGLAPFSLGVCAALGGHACATGTWCTLFIATCVVGGLVAGLFVGSSLRGSWHELLAGAVLAGLTGALGCVVAGALGLFGLSLGLLLGAAPMYALRQRERWV